MIRTFLFLLLGTLSLPAPLVAQQYNIQNVARLDILPGYPTATGHMIAARIQLRDGWKTYWRAPGGNGIPPVFDWNGSKNIGAVAFHWPRPTVFVDNGVQTIGYESELILPISITPRSAGKPVVATGEVTFGVCEDICIPVKARFSIDVSGTNAVNRTAIRAALAQKPSSAQSAGVRKLTCEISPIEDGFNIVASVTTAKTLPSGVISVVEFPHPEVWVEQSATRAAGRTVTASANLFAYGETPLILDRSKITLTLLGDNRAIELRGCPS